MEDLQKLLADIYDKEEIKPIKKGEGLIAYRKYLWAIKFIEDSLLKLQEYKQEVVDDIDKAIDQKQKQVEAIKSEIEKAIMADPIADETKSGGKRISLPDIATVSISKLIDKIDIEDRDKVMEELGEDFQRVKVSLDTRKAKKYIEESGNIPEGASKRQERRFSIRFKK